jgi:hypothetical protein
VKTLKISDETHRVLTMVKGEIMAKTGDANLTYDDAIFRLVKLWNENTERAGAAFALEPYHFVRFKWWDRVDLERMAEELSEGFSVEWSSGPESENEISLRKEERNMLKVRADTLNAYLDVYKAVIFQREPAPFTNRDAMLRERLFEVYTRSRPTPFPWQYLDEPKFVVQE